MLKVSKLADYGVMIVLKFAQNPERLYSATELISMTGLNLPTVRKILKLLSISGILLARRGADGGYALAKHIGFISVLDVVESIDGQLAFTECCAQSFKSCSVGNCQMGSYWHAINKKVRATLSEFAIEDLIKKPYNDKEIMQHG